MGQHRMGCTAAAAAQYGHQRCSETIPPATSTSGLVVYCLSLVCHKLHPPISGRPMCRIVGVEHRYHYHAHHLISLVSVFLLVSVISQWPSVFALQPPPTSGNHWPPRPPSPPVEHNLFNTRLPPVTTAIPYTRLNFDLRSPPPYTRFNFDPQATPTTPTRRWLNYTANWMAGPTTEPSNWTEVTTPSEQEVWDNFIDRLGQMRLMDMLIILIGGSLSFLTIFGNVLVMVAFKIDRNLQTISNYFLLTLAVADFLIGFISMPLSLIYIVAGDWPLGPTACDFWLSIDYLNSNASVLNLLLISFDRYFSVTRPLTYRAKRTTRRACLFIAFAWIISALLWPPWIFAWSSIEGRRIVPHYQCYIPFLESNVWVTVITAIIAFWIPITIMSVLYWHIWQETEKRYRELTSLVVTPNQQRTGDQNGRKPKPRPKSRTKTHLPNCPKNAVNRNKLRASLAATSSIGSTLPVELSSIGRSGLVGSESIPPLPCIRHHQYECAQCVQPPSAAPLTSGQPGPHLFSTHDYTDVIRLDEISGGPSGGPSVLIRPFERSDTVDTDLGQPTRTKTRSSLVKRLLCWRKPEPKPLEVAAQCPACLHQKRLKRRRRLLAKRQMQLARMESEPTNGTTTGDEQGPKASESALVTVHEPIGNSQSNDVSLSGDSSESSIYTIVIKLQPRKESGEPTATVHMVCNETPKPSILRGQLPEAGVTVPSSGGISFVPKRPPPTQRTSSTQAETGSDEEDEDDSGENGSDDGVDDELLAGNGSESERCDDGEMSDDDSIRVRMCCSRKKPSTSGGGSSVSAPQSLDPDPISARVRTTIQPKSDRKAAKTLSAILMAFILTWTPYNVLGKSTHFFPNKPLALVSFFLYCKPPLFLHRTQNYLSNHSHNSFSLVTRKLYIFSILENRYSC